MIDNLSEWMTKGGADLSKIEVRFYDKEFRGVHAKQDIERDSIVMFVPKSQMITPDVVS